MSNHGIGPTDGDRKSDRYKEQLAFPQSTAPDDLSETVKRLGEIEIHDRKEQTVSLERIVLGLRALNEAESQYRSCQMLNGRGIEGAQAVLESLCEMSQKILSDLRARKKDVPADEVQLGAVLGDKLASIWAQYFVATDAEPEVLGIAKNLCSILGLGKLRNIDDLPQQIKEASHLSPIARFGLWGVSQSYFSVLADDTRLAQHSGRVLMCSFGQADAARELAESPPKELALLRGAGHTKDSHEAFKVALELLINSVLTGTQRAREQEIILRAEKVSELLAPFLGQLEVSQLRSWMMDYSMTCRQAHEQGEFDHAKRMWNRLKVIAHGAGDSVAVDALRFTARRIKSDMGQGDVVSAQQGIDEFRAQLKELNPEMKRALSSEEMTVGQVAISLRLREAQESPFYEHAQVLLSDACKELDTLASLAELNPWNGMFMVVESLLEVSMAYLERDDIDQSRDRALDLWKRACDLYYEGDERCADETLYTRISCRVMLADVGAFFNDRDIQASQREALEKLWAPLVAILEAKDLKDYERTSYQFAQINLLRTLAAVQCSLDEEGSGGGVNAIVRALSLYQTYSPSDTDLSLIRALYEVAIHVHEKNHRYVEATQFRQKLERLG